MEALSAPNAKRVYDRIGRLQDTQAFYEDRFTAHAVEHAALGEASRVVEFGCGTGRFAAGLLSRHLGAEASYLALDQSTTMVRLARRRLAPWASRVEVRQTDGAVRVEEPAGSADRFLSNFVMDLLDDGAIDGVIEEAHRLLVPGGRLALVSMTEGDRALDRMVLAAVRGLWRIDPRLTGGCRPVRLEPRLDGARWEIQEHHVGRAFGISSEVLVARRR